MKQKRGSMIFRFALIAVMVFVFATIFVACGKDDKNGGVYDGNAKLAMNEEFFEKFVGFVLKNTLEDNTYAWVHIRDYSRTEESGVGGSSIIGIFQTKETTCEVYMFENEEDAKIFYSDYSDRDDEELSVSILGGSTVTITYGTEDYSAPKDVNFYQNEILNAKIPANSISNERLSFIKKSLSAIKDGYASFEYTKSNNCIEPFSDKEPETYEKFCFEEVRNLSPYIRDYSFEYTNSDIDKQELSEIATKLDTDYGEGSYVDTTRENGFIFAELYGKDSAA